MTRGKAEIKALRAVVADLKRRLSESDHDAEHLLAQVWNLTAENDRLRHHLSAYSDGRPVLRQPEGPTP
ncbi:hypothetical protein [Cumulibacter soli]|uniref:hypothetical protein n=1 Tax=Cumulibacter soli TaxID=2546344 RepID=UPI0010674774|nr:hypothetical protein [Cumulibacter soli]